MPKPLRTSDLAKAVGIHPNTVRLYEAWGFLPPVERSASGYRLFTPTHLAQLKLARLALHGGWPGRAIRASALALVRRSAAGDLGGALEQAYSHLALVQAERAQAEAAVSYLKRWATGAPVDPTARPLSISQTAKLINTTIDTLRSWERNGLLRVPRNPKNDYRLYGTPEIGRLRVIRLLIRSGYSTMAILRMLTVFDEGRPARNLRAALDTPHPDEEVYLAADQWLSTLTAQAERARSLIKQIQAMLRRKKGR